MIWYAGAILILLVRSFSAGLLAYAMYALLGVMLVSRWLTRSWAASLCRHAAECNNLAAEVGETSRSCHDREHGQPPDRLGAAGRPAAKAAIMFDPPRSRASPAAASS